MCSVTQLVSRILRLELRTHVLNHHPRLHPDVAVVVLDVLVLKASFPEWLLNLFTYLCSTSITRIL